MSFRHPLRAASLAALCLIAQLAFLAAPHAAYAVGTADGFVSVGTTTNPTSEFGVYGGATIGTSYNGTLAPTNGLLVQGNVGIGTTGPTYPLSVYGAQGSWPNYASIQLSVGGNEAPLMLTNTGTGGHSWDITSEGGASSGGQGSLSFYDVTQAALRLDINANGNVGIGTTSPQSKLHIQAGEVQVGSSGAACGVANAGAIRYSGGELYYCDNTPAWQTINTSGNVDTGDYYIATQTAAPTTGQGMFGGDATLGGVLAGFGSTADVTLENRSNTPALEIRANSTNIYMPGNVGIGTAGPTTNLDVYGTGAAPSLSSDTGLFKVSGNVSQELAFGEYTTNPWAFWMQTKRVSNDGTTWPLAINPLGGNVGIGTTNPATVLHLYRTGASDYLTIDADAGNQSALQFAKATAEKWIQYIPANSNDLRFYDTTDRVTFQNGGNVGIGTASPQQSLHVVGNIRKDFSASSSGGTSYWMIVSNDGNGNWSEYINSNGTTTPTAVADGAAFRRTFSPGEPSGVNIYYQQYAPPVYLGTSQVWVDYLAVDANNNYLTLMDGGSGKVGIGTATPQVKLDIAGSAATYVTGTEDEFHITRPLASGTSFPQVAAFQLGTYNATSACCGPQTRLGINLKAAANATLTGDTNVMTLQSNGLVGIGTTTPIATLDVNGYAHLAKNSSQPIACDAAHDGSLALASTRRPCECVTSAWIDVVYGTACSW